MRFILATLLTLTLSYISGLFLPWWSIAPVAFLVALLIRQAAGISFLSGFLGVFLLWSVLAFWIDSRNDGILSARIANVLPLGGSGVLLILVTGFVGGLVAGMAALCGGYVHGRQRRG
jgi:hypothetical protein